MSRGVDKDDQRSARTRTPSDLGGTPIVFWVVYPLLTFFLSSARVSAQLNKNLRKQEPQPLTDYPKMEIQSWNVKSEAYRAPGTGTPTHARQLYNGH